jgi:HEAT repeat protein
MAQAPQLSSELARGVLQWARALLAAARATTLYPPEHPAVGQALARLVDAVPQTSAGAIFSIGITPETLLVEGAPADASHPSIAEAAGLLHDRDILQLTFIGQIPTTALRSLLRMLALDHAERRERGGPAVIWAADGHSSILIDQIDYRRVLEREEGEVPEARRRDDVWRSILMSITAPAPFFDEQAQQRLLAMAGSPADIGDLALAVMAPKFTMDGSPMITSQAAAVLAAFRHLTNIVTVMAPERVNDLMSNLAAATAQLDPHVVMQVLQREQDASDPLGVVRGIAAEFDDAKVAQLLATALALDGQASDRLATIFNTIAPDEDRKRRVLTLTRNMLSETDFGRAGQFNVLWTAMEELLVSYNDRPFVSDMYRTALDGMGERADRIVTSGAMPPEITEWLQTLGQDNVRTLSVMLLIDLLTIEREPSRAEEIAADMEALAEDLLMAGAYADARTVARALVTRAAETHAIGRDACRLALDRLGESPAMRETASLAGEVDDAGWSEIAEVLRLIGPPSIESMRPLLMTEDDTTGSMRAADLVASFGTAAIGRLAPLVGDPRWFVQRSGARLLGRIGSPEAVPLLQPLLRKGDPRVGVAAVAALIGIDDPSAARAIHTVLRAATGELRRAVIDALVADRDPRVVPMLIRIVQESQPLGNDHAVVLEAAAALGAVGTDEAVPPLVILINQRGFFGRRRLRALKQCGVDALARIGTPEAATALRAAAATGDRMLRKILAAKK